MTEESHNRRARLTDLLRDADYYATRQDWQQALDRIEHARSIVLAELLSEEHEQMRQEMAEATR